MSMATIADVVFTIVATVVAAALLLFVLVLIVSSWHPPRYRYEVSRFRRRCRWCGQEQSRWLYISPQGQVHQWRTSGMVLLPECPCNLDVEPW